MSDIHGNNDLFRKSLKKIGLNKRDKLILLGDLIDRGSDSKEVLDTVILLLNSGFDVKCILGNHERMFLDALVDLNSLNHWMLNGGDKTLMSFLTSSIEKIPIRYFDLIRSFENYMVNDDFILVHAALNMKIKDPFSDINTMLWDREPHKYLDPVWLGHRKLIHGHTPLSQYEIIHALNSNEKIVCIDNGVYINRIGYGALCVLQLETLELNFCK